MDTTRFKTNRHDFRILDFVAMFAAKTDTSITFQLGRYSDTLTFPDSDPIHIGGQGVFNVFGWADVHHPCHDHIKARIRVRLSDDLMVFEAQREIVNALFDALSIPRDETYEADFHSSGTQTAIHQSVDRDGMSDRM